jgi:hypothetical protein
MYFAASEEDDYCIPGFNKDEKHQQPQIIIGLLVSNHGYPIRCQIFEGNTSETKTLILELFKKNLRLTNQYFLHMLHFCLKKILMLYKKTLQIYSRWKAQDENEAIKAKVIELGVEEGMPRELKSRNGRLIVSYSQKRRKRIESIGKEAQNQKTDQRPH